MKRALVACVLTLLLACSRREEAPPPPAASPAPGGPKVVLIVVDTLRSDHLSQYGYPLPTSTALDGFAAQATLFTSAWAPAPWTTPSTASIHSGLSPFRHAATRLGDTLQPEVLTLAERLKARGLATIGFSYNNHISKPAGFAQGFDGFLEHQGATLHYPPVSKMVDYALVWAKRNGASPFFLYLHPMSCHGPYLVPEARQSDLLGRRPTEGFRYFGRLMKDVMSPQDPASPREVSPEIVTSLLERYDTAVRFSMDEVGRLFAGLQAQGWYDESLIVLTSDHGEELFDHGGFSHGFTLHREVLQVPLMIKLPHQKEARRVDTPVTLMDVLPTVLDVIGAPADPGLDGQSLLPAAAGTGRVEERPRLFSVSWPGRAVAKALEEGPWKLVRLTSSFDGRQDTHLLYDVAKDRAESTDLAETHPEERARQATRLDTLAAAAAVDALPQAENILEKMDFEALEALGYVQ